MSFIKRYIEKLRDEGKLPSHSSEEDYLYEQWKKEQQQIEEYEKNKKTAEESGIPPELI